MRRRGIPNEHSRSREFMEPSKRTQRSSRQDRRAPFGGSRIDFHNSTHLDSERILRFCRDMAEGWNLGRVELRVRFSRGADFSGACYYRERRIFVNLGAHLEYPYSLKTNLARAKSARTHWHREVFAIELESAYQLVYFVFLHELYHLKIHVARRNRRQKEAMCDRFAARVLVDRFGLVVINHEGAAVPRETWDFQDLDGFVSAARSVRQREPGMREAFRQLPLFSSRRPLVMGTK